MAAWHPLQFPVGRTVVAGQIDVAVVGEYEVLPELEGRDVDAGRLQGAGGADVQGRPSGKVFFEDD